jgi:RNA polymerase sigma-70 factor (ECF subfamily)
VADDDLHDRLSRIQTLWSKILDGRPGADAPQADAQQKQLLLRYYGAAYRYLLAIVRESQAAEELAQDFAVRFMRGEFRQADPERGRFRDFLKTALRNLARDHWRKQQRAREHQPESFSAVEPPAPPDEAGDAQFVADWRDELLEKTWEALAEFEQSSGKPYCAVLRLKTWEPNLRSPELAARLGQALGKTFSPEPLRQTLHRAREAFADLLLDEVNLSLSNAGLERLEEELIELQLMDYCRLALERRKGRGRQTST